MGYDAVVILVILAQFNLISKKLELQEASYIGHPHLFIDSVESTNKYAMELLSNSNPIEGTAISAGFQTDGRGQIGRTWWGDAYKNLYTSLIINPSHIEASNQWIINQAISLGVSDCLESIISKPVKIKWPNDIYIEDRKISGILIQCVLSGKIIQNAIIGIGMNVNQDSFPPEIRNPTSIYLESTESYDLVKIRNSLYRHLEHWYGVTKTQSWENIKISYLNRLYRKDEPSAFMKGKSVIYGSIVGVDEIGRLMLLINDKIESFNFNEVKMIINKEIV